ncbi:hypothetical protein MIMGU_mgv1a0209251mg, partial [Erythranthe guttata]
RKHSTKYNRQPKYSRERVPDSPPRAGSRVPPQGQTRR